MAKDYAAISKKIVENIGGVENIASVTHCMTRLRFVVKDEGKINDAAVKATDGVMGVVNQGGQYQIIIGNHVEEAYNEVLKMGDFGEASPRPRDGVQDLVGLAVGRQHTDHAQPHDQQVAPGAAVSCPGRLRGGRTPPHRS